MFRLHLGVTSACGRIEVIMEALVKRAKIHSENKRKPPHERRKENYAKIIFIIFGGIFLSHRMKMCHCDWLNKNLNGK